MFKRSINIVLGVLLLAPLFACVPGETIVQNGVTTTFTENVTIQGDDGAGNILTFRVDGLTQTFVSLPYDHFELHEGHAFGYATTQNLSGGDNVTILLRAHPTIPIHWQVSVESIAEASMTLNEAVVVSNNGTSQVLINRNRTSNNTAQSLVFLNPTVTNYGTLLYPKRWGSGKGVGGGAGIEEGWIFSPNTWYAIVIKNETVTSQYVSIDMVEYVH